MKLPHFLLGISVILPATHGFLLTIMAPSALMDQAKVWGKKTSEGDPVEMTRANDDPGSGPLCATPVFSLELNCDEKDFYHGFANVFFSQPTDLPREIDVIMPDYTLNVSHSLGTRWTDSEVYCRNHHDGSLLCVLVCGLGTRRPWGQSRFHGSQVHK